MRKLAKGCPVVVVNPGSEVSRLLKAKAPDMSPVS